MSTNNTMRAKMRWGVILALVLSALSARLAHGQAIAFVGTGASNIAGGGTFTSISISVPAGVMANDLLLAQISVRGGAGTTLTPDAAGWTLVIRTNSGDLGQAIYRRVATAAEPADYTFSLGSAVRLQGQMLAYRNVDTVIPVDAASGAGASSNSISAPSVTTVRANSMLVAYFGIARAGTSITEPGSMSARSYVTGGAGPNGVAVVAADELQAAIGASGPRTASASSSAANVGQLLALRPGGCVPASFTVDPGAGTASTCVPRNVAITARDASNAVLTCYTGTINISTTTARGDWSLITGNGTFAAIGSNAGTAQYAFSALDNGSATLALSNQHADDLRVNVADSVVPATLSQSPVIQFRDNVFVLTEDPIQVAGRPQAMSLAMWRRDTSGDCGIAAGYAGNRNLKAWLTRDGSDPGGTAPTIGAASLPNSAPGANNVTLSFAAGTVNFSLGTTDVGKYVLNLRDDSRSFASGVDINGSSTTLTVRPFGLTVTDVQSGAIPNPGGTATTGAAFTPAGETFSATVTARLWQAADDSNNDGVPDPGANLADNAATPSYRWTTQLSLSTPITPASGSPGVLGGTLTIVPASFAGGAATITNLTYSEVGSMTLRADGSNFLNTAGVNPTGTSGSIGRFYPDHFSVLAGSSVTAACAAGNFSYMGQAGIGLVFTIEARNKFDMLTTKYNNTVYSTGAVSSVAENDNDGVERTARLTSLPAGSWVNGVYTVNAGTLGFSRIAAPDGPFEDLEFGVQVMDPDGAVLNNRDMNPATAGDCVAAANCVAVKIGSGETRARFGRLRLTNATGSSLLDLPLAIETQYFNGVGFVRNADDGCTTFPATAIGLGNYQGNLGPLASCKTAIETPAGDVIFAAGRAQNVKLRKPGSANAGSLDFGANLGAAVTFSETCTAVGAGAASASATVPANLPFLRSNWGSGAFDEDPLSRATFGIYRNANEFIYFRENF